MWKHNICTTIAIINNLLSQFLLLLTFLIFKKLISILNIPCWQYIHLWYEKRKMKTILDVWINMSYIVNSVIFHHVSLAGVGPYPRKACWYHYSVVYILLQVWKYFDRFTSKRKFLFMIEVYYHHTSYVGLNINSSIGIIVFVSFV